VQTPKLFEGKNGRGYRSLTSESRPKNATPTIDMLNEALGLKTASLSSSMDETCRTVYAAFRKTFDLHGNWQLAVRAVDPDRIFIKSISPTGSHREFYFDSIAPEAQLATDLVHHLHSHYRRYREELRESG
jgi:hypothetical protein